MNNLIKILKNNEVVNSFESLKEVVLDDTIGVSYLIGAVFNKSPKNILILASNLYNAEQIYNNLIELVDKNSLFLFPEDEILRAESFVSNSDLLGERLFVLNEALKEDKKKIIIANSAAILKCLPNPINYKNATIKLKTGDKSNILKLTEKLTISGYYRVNKVSQSLEFSKRGDILDIFSLNYDLPIRISFFDDEIESIYFFNPITQLRKEKIDDIEILPANELLFSKNKEEITEKLKKQLNEDLKFLDSQYKQNLKDKIDDVINNLENLTFKRGIYKYFSFINEEYFSLLDYFKADIIFIANNEQFNSSITLLKKEEREYLDELFDKGECLSHLELFNNIDRVLKNKKIKYGLNFKAKNDVLFFNVQPVYFLNQNDNIIAKNIKNLLEINTVIICLNNVSEIERIKKILSIENLEYVEIKDLNFQQNKINLTIYALYTGVDFKDEKITILTSKEIFNIKHSSLYSSVFKSSNILNNYEELKEGDYVVHEYKGIGIFRGIKTLESGDNKIDYLLIDYAKKAKLYVPLNQFHLIRKYSGREGFVPKLTDLSTSSWERSKKRIKSKISDLTKRLKNLYKERLKIQGYQFSHNDENQEKFNSEFQFDLTKDQEEAFYNISLDMEKSSPMDRLLCGDVGYGKTEVAFRAIFKCINSNKQAMLLCPTVLLCRQHYELAKIRFASFNIKIAVFSRLVSKKDQAKYIQEIKENKIQLIIGTHRLLGKDIVTNNLGLLVIDEEQRFGVEHKERIKEMVKNVDVLSLSATPIPRTLQMSLVGIRSLSKINTPPKKRSPIQTYVTPYDINLVKEIIERELHRKGQIYYIFNNTFLIYEKAKTLQKLVPNIRLGIVHSKMEKEKIEDVMLNFYLGNIDMLIATTIIENGLDVSNANLIIVEDANNFGLSQLYQIKGRVGRSDKIAYAYLFYNDQKQMNEEGQKRLKAIQEFTSLGSGYKIAERDLMLRGAGNILGKDQAGFIDELGMDLYLKLLNESLASQEENYEILEDKPQLAIQSIGYVPDEFANDSLKIEIYQEIGSAKNFEELENIKNKLVDMYGRLPNEIMNIITNKKSNILLNNEEFSSYKVEQKRTIISLKQWFTSTKNVGLKLFNVLLPLLDKIKIVNMNGKIEVIIQKQEDFETVLFNTLLRIHNLYLEIKNEIR